jgi:hypothetical protein
LPEDNAGLGLAGRSKKVYRVTNKTTAMTLLLLLAYADCAMSGEESHAKKPKRIKVNPADDETSGFNFTEEFNLYRNAVYSNTVIDYATRSAWVFGLQLLNVPAYGSGAQNYEYDGYFTLSKTFKFNQSWALAVGTQVGTVLANVAPKQLHNFTFANGLFTQNDWLNYSIGPFYVNDALATIHQPVGVMAGFEVRIVPRLLHLQGDYFSGNSNISGGIVNAVFYPLPNLQTYCGVNVPGPHSGNEFSGNLGIIYNLK